MIAHLQDAQHFLRMTVRALDCAAHQAPNHRWGRAVGAILALEQNPSALDNVGTIDIDAAHRKARDD